MLEAAYNLFVKILSLSAMASVLALLILATRFLIKNRLKPTWTYLLWIPLIVRLAVPWTPESAFSIFNLFPLETESALTFNIPSAQPDVGDLPVSGMNIQEVDSTKVAEITGTRNFKASRETR